MFFLYSLQSNVCRSLSFFEWKILIKNWVHYDMNFRQLLTVAIQVK